MGANENSLLYLFFGVSTITLLWRIVRDKDWTNFTPDNLQTSWKFLGIVSIVCALIFFGLETVKSGLGMLSGAACFIGTFLLSSVLSELNVAPFSRGIIILFATVGATLLIGSGHPQSTTLVSSLLGGLCVWKLASNIRRPELATLLDFVPAFVWLSGWMWWLGAHSGATAAVNLAMVLGVLTISTLMRWVQLPLLWEDPVYLKRIVISISSGLVALIVFNKLLLATNFTQLAGVAGVGYLASFLLTTLDMRKGDSPIQDALTKLALVGALTLLAGRLYGTEGMLILAAAAVVNARSGLAQMAAVFWASRVLQQSYTELYNSNVTGININHEYVGAALYFGFAAAAVICLALRNYKTSNLLAGALTFGALAVAAGASYLLHIEPTASLVVGTVVGSSILGMSGKEIFGADFEHYQSVVLVPALFTGFCILFSPLLEVGSSATTHDRLVVVGALIVVLLVGTLISFLMGGGLNKKPTELEGSDIEPATPAAS